MKRYLALLGTLLISCLVQAEIPGRPDPPRLVNDFAGILNQTEYNNLESKLEQFARETSTQIVVVTVPDLEGYDPGDYAFRLGEKWGVGQQGKDNGLIILIKPKTAREQGRIFIATGYGLESVLPDAVVNGAIIDNEMIPYFKAGNYYQGVEKGIDVIMDITRGEYTAEYYRENSAGESGGLPFVLILFLLFFVVIPLLRGRSRRFYSPGKNLPLWIALGMLSGGRHSGSFNNFSSGSGGFGGFGGFGGGSFGGGGAGGSW
jgi:uncharacterized protein